MAGVLHRRENGRVPSVKDIVTFHDPSIPEGQSPYVSGAVPSQHVEVVDPQNDWPEFFTVLATRIRGALGWRALEIDHVGSTAVERLPAKPIIDIDLVVADPNDEPSYVPALESVGFELRVREPWWFGHRVLRHVDPACNLHVFGYDSPEVVKHRIFRDWLRANPGERELYADAKREAASQAQAAGEHAMQYNERKEEIIREIYHRAFLAAGLLSAETPRMGRE